MIRLESWGTLLLGILIGAGAACAIVWIAFTLAARSILV